MKLLKAAILILCVVALGSTARADDTITISREKLACILRMEIEIGTSVGLVEAQSPIQDAAKTFCSNSASTTMACVALGQVSAALKALIDQANRTALARTETCGVTAAEMAPYFNEKAMR